MPSCFSFDQDPTSFKYVIRSYQNWSRVLDMTQQENKSGAKSVVCHEYHGNTNQQWQIQSAQNGSYMIQNVYNGSYLAVQTPEANSCPLVGIADPQADFYNSLWDIYLDDGNVCRIFAHGSQSPLNADVIDNGHGETVQLWGSWNGSNQKWIFEAVLQPPPQPPPQPRR